MGAALSFLIVDDEPLVQRALSSVLKRYGACSAAPSARSAEFELSRSWDGLLLDVRLGVVPGAWQHVQHALHGHALHARRQHRLHLRHAQAAVCAARAVAGVR